jgi:hypothetical protein
MLWLPTVRADVAKVAVPALRLAVPRVVAPSLNVTVPPALLGVTVAVKVTLCPKAEEGSEETTTVEEVAWFTTCVTVLEVLPL